MKAVLVGEAWGKRESDFQHALVGPSGRELTLELGASGLAPYMNLRCRKCKNITQYITPQCEHCKDFVWPDEFSLMDHWKRLKSDYSIHVTNVFNVKPPDMCRTCLGTSIEWVGNRARCKVCQTFTIRMNYLGYFFSREVETDLPPFRSQEASPHLKAEHLHHLKRLWRELDDLKPNLIVAMGNTPCWALLGQTKITALRGTVNWSDRLGIKVLPTFHPAAVIRPTGHAMRPTVIADYQKAAREMEFPEIRRRERFLTIPAPNASGIEEIREWLRRPAYSYANDIETLRGHISVVGLARSAQDALIIPFRDAHTKNGRITDIGRIATDLGFPSTSINFWPTSDLEFEAWKLVRQAEESDVEKIFQNGLYDMSYFIKMGIHPKNPKHDTMLWHHSEFPELPKSLGYLGSIYSNEVSWKQMSRTESAKRDE